MKQISLIPLLALFLVGLPAAVQAQLSDQGPSSIPTATFDVDEVVDDRGFPLSPEEDFAIGPDGQLVALPIPEDSTEQQSSQRGDN